jgi:hypothetical protein
MLGGVDVAESARVKELGVAGLFLVEMSLQLEIFLGGS